MGGVFLRLYDRNVFDKEHRLVVYWWGCETYEVIHVIRNNVRKIMDDLGVSVTDLANETGVNRSVLGRLYRNEVNNINLGVLDAVCRHLQVPVAWLLEFVEDSHLTDEDRQHLQTREHYAQRTHDYWERYKEQKKAPNGV